MLDEAKNVRSGEEINRKALNNFLSEEIKGFSPIKEILQFPGGYSNLTYLIKTDYQEYVLRKPPLGANIKSAHDMSREFDVLNLLYQVYKKIPTPVFYYPNNDLIGSPFYIMERVKGVILRNNPPKDIKLNAELMGKISRNCIRNLSELHQLDIQKSGLADLGKPSGYVQRQVEGWTKRYANAVTEDINAMNEIISWMPDHIPDSSAAAFIHNDYKYDNLILDPKNLATIKAVLDWEMATVGDPLMDLGSTLAYWAEPKDNDLLKPFNLTWLPGNLNREEVVETYFETSILDQKNVLFYYVFGCFKISVIVQQIYARYKKGLTNDSRFKNLNYVVAAMISNANKATKYNRISHFY